MVSTNCLSTDGRKYSLLTYTAWIRVRGKRRQRLQGDLYGSDSGPHALRGSPLTLCAALRPVADQGEGLFGACPGQDTCRRAFGCSFRYI